MSSPERRFVLAIRTAISKTGEAELFRNVVGEVPEGLSREALLVGAGEGELQRMIGGPRDFLDWKRRALGTSPREEFKFC